MNNFGYGGTNAHAILEEARPSAPYHEPRNPDNDPRADRLQVIAATSAFQTQQAKEDAKATVENKRFTFSGGGMTAGVEAQEFDRAVVPKLFVISARSEHSIHKVAENLKSWASTSIQQGDYLEDLAYTLSNRRSMMQWRRSFVVDSFQDFVASLDQTINAKKILSDYRVGFVFTGQGGQWFAMGRDLMLKSSKFTNSLLRSDQLLRDLGAPWSLIEELSRNESSSRINESEISQPATTCLQIALVDLLKDLGIRPEMVLGHSSGEIAAAYAAGVFPQAVAIKISYCRGLISNHCRQRVSNKGAMLAVGLGYEAVMPLIAKTQRGVVSVACLNSPSSTTVSGDEGAILELEEILTQLEIFNKKLNVDTAYHSHHMEKVAHDYLLSLNKIDAQVPMKNIKFMSSVTGLQKNTGFDQNYWVKNLTSKVYFHDALEEYCRTQVADSQSNSQSITTQLTHILIEIGPHSVLAGPIHQTIRKSFSSFNYIYIPSLIRGRSALRSVLELSGKMFEQGYPIEVGAASSLSYSKRHHRVINDLPAYPWDHSNTYWCESGLSHDYRLRKSPFHDLLGVRVPSSTSLEPSWRYIISVDILPWLTDHIVDGLVIFPGAGYICMAIEAIRQFSRENNPSQTIQNFDLKNVLFLKALVIPSNPKTVDIRISLKTPQSGTMKVYEFRISALSEDEVWYDHCQGFIKLEEFSFKGELDEFNIGQSDTVPKDQLLDIMMPDCPKRLSPENIYSQLQSNGNIYGACFAAIAELNIGDSMAIGHIRVPNVESIMPSNYMQPHIIHPTTLDALMHTCLPLYTQRYGVGPVMPVFVGEMHVSADISNTPGSMLLAATTLVYGGEKSAKADILVFDLFGTKQEPLLTISDTEVHGFAAAQAAGWLDSACTRNMSFQMKWGADVDYISCETNGSVASVSIKHYLTQLSFKYSQMNVLQIGAQNGNTTISILQTLCNIGTESLRRYDVTDTSPALYHQAQRLLKDWANLLSFKILDIEQDVVSQGFSAGSYDLIIATSVFRTVNDLKNLTANAQKLLKAGGRLLFLAEESFPFSIDQFNSTLMQHSFNGVELAIDKPQDLSQIGTFIVSRAVVIDSHRPIYPIKIIANPGIEAFARDIFEALKHRGFETSFTTWGASFTEGETIYLVLDSGMKPLLLNPPSEIFKQITKLTNGSFNVFWISAPEDASAAMNPEKGLVVGLARSARAENDYLKFITLDVQQTIDRCSPKLLHAIVDMALVSFGNSKLGDQIEEPEFVYRDGQVLIPRLIPYQKMNDWMKRSAGKPAVQKIRYGQPDRPLKLKTLGIRSVENVYFVDDESIQPCLDPLMIEVSVKAYCMESMSDIGFPAQTENSSLRVCEFAGTISAIGSRVSPNTTFRVGDRVCGWSLDTACYASCIRVCSNNLAHVPNPMSLVIGATIPVPFMTAYYSLVEIASLQRRQTVLIRGAAGVMGEAALSLSLYIGARVFATVSSPTERGDLVKRFNLSPTCIFLENSTGFKTNFFRSTFGNGADVIFNALASPDLASDLWACIALLGVFIQIGRQADGRNAPIGISLLDRNATFVSFDLTTVIRCRPQKVATLLAKVMALVTAGAILPNERITTVPIQHLGDALRMIQSRRYSETVVIETEGNSQVNVLSTRHAVTHTGQFKLDADATYVIAGGLGDIGQRICRLIASRGAKNVVILSRRALNRDRRREIEDELQSISPGLTIYSLACDISNKSMVNEVVAGFEKIGLSPVKGVVQAAAILQVSLCNPLDYCDSDFAKQDGILERMNVHDFQLPLQPKVYGTRSLYQAFESSDLDFFIMLSSLSGTIGTRGQANYAAGNTFQDALANNQTVSKTHYISLNIGMVEGAAVYKDEKGKAREQNLLQHGLIPVKSEELLAFLDYSISPQAREDPCRQAIIGIDGRSIYEAENRIPTTRSGIFNHVRGAYNGLARSDAAESHQKAIANAQSRVEVHRIIATAIVHKLSSLIALEDHKIELESPLSEFGINSLIAIQLKSWITQEFHTKIESSEILDEQSIMALSLIVASRSPLTQQGSGEILKTKKNVRMSGKDDGIPHVLHSSLAGGFQQHVNVAPKLPQLPLPSLESTLELYLASAHPFLSEDELIHTSNAIREFQEGIGPQLQQHLIDRSKNPQIDNWQHELQVNGIYLKRRDPIHPYGTFYGVHLLTKTPHSQSTRAAIISVAAYNFKQRMDAGELEQDYLHEQLLCMNSLKWLFNANRTPSIGIDELHKYPGNNYLVALRRGHIFKVMLTSEEGSASYTSLKTTFEAILNSSDERQPTIATLSADERNSWARLRNTLKSLDEGNVTLMAMIEAAAFIVCLDDESPITPTERCNNFLLGDPSNRWSDKSLQFVICRNGLSGYVCEHSMLDALSLKQLNRFITKAILQHKSEPQKSSSAIEASEILSEEYTFKKNKVIEAQIESIQKNFKKTHVLAEAAHFNLPHFGHKFLESHKIPSKTGYQLIIQLASLLHFGQQFPSWEVLAMMPFHKGRLDWMQVVSPAMVAFCRAAAAAIPTAGNKTGLETLSELRTLIRKAAMVHVRIMTRIARGRGFAAHMEALHEIVVEQLLPEDVPALFRDQTWEKIIRVTNTRKIKTDASEEMMVLEGGFYMPDPESVLVHYEIEDDGGHFYIQSGSSQGRGVERFCNALEEAAGIFKRVFAT